MVVEDTARVQVVKAPHFFLIVFLIWFDMAYTWNNNAVVMLIYHVTVL